MFLDYVSSIESDDGKSSIWSNDTVSYVSTTQPSSLESNIEPAESVFSSLVLADNLWDRQPLPPICCDSILSLYKHRGADNSLETCFASCQPNHAQTADSSVLELHAVTAVLL